jgi:hypothetical protein
MGSRPKGAIPLLPNLFEQWEEKKNDKGVSPAIVFVLSGVSRDRDRREQSLFRN